MRLIDADTIKIPSTHVDIFENCRNCRLLDESEVKQIIDDAPTIYAVPISELRELFNKLYDEDAITFRALYDMNHLIGKHLRGETDES